MLDLGEKKKGKKLSRATSARDCSGPRPGLAPRWSDQVAVAAHLTLDESFYSMSRELHRSPPRCPCRFCIHTNELYTIVLIKGKTGS